MRTMSFKTTDIVATLIFHLIHSAYAADHFPSCNVTALEPCPGNNQICNETSHECVCMKGFTRVGDDCLHPDDNSSVPHATAALVTIFTLALVICGLVLVVRKYDLLEYARQKINLRRNNDVMYEDVMIGQDDPPLSL